MARVKRGVTGHAKPQKGPQKPPKAITAAQEYDQDRKQAVKRRTQYASATASAASHLRALWIQRSMRRCASSASPTAIYRRSARPGSRRSKVPRTSRSAEPRVRAVVDRQSALAA